MKNYYKILQVDKHASHEQIKKSYRKLALQYHPDRNQGNKTSEERFKEISEAYEILSDPHKRAAYNAEYEYHTSPRPDAYAQQQHSYNYTPPKTTYQRSTTSQTDTSWIRFVGLGLFLLFQLARTCNTQPDYNFSSAGTHRMDNTDTSRINEILDSLTSRP